MSNRVLARPRHSFIAPCLPTTADQPPTGPDWVHEIKHDGYRLMARRDPVGIRLLTRNGHDWADRYPLIVEAVNQLKAGSCLIDGEAVRCDENGLAVFERMRRKREGRHVFLYAFDLLELNGADLRQEPFEVRKSTLSSVLRQSHPRFNEHLPYAGDVFFRYACKMDLGGIVSKRLGSRYRSGRSPDWLKFKNPDWKQRRIGVNASSRMERHVWRTKDGFSLQLVFPDVRGGSRAKSHHADAYGQGHPGGGDAR